jgi:hypothetical protein
MPNSYNFPFIGISSYALATSCQLLVKFYEEPTEHQKNEIISSAPLAIGLDLTNLYWLLIDKLKHGIAHQIEDQYGKGGKGLMMLQQKIEAWLNAVHQYCPIEIAVQPDYYDEFDTERNEWHKQSMTMAIPILEKWLNEPEERYRSHDFEFSHLSIFVKEITSYLDEDEHQRLIERSLRVYNPKEYTSRLLDKKENNVLLQLINEKQRDVEYLLQIMDELSDYLEDVLSVDTKIEYCIYHLTRHLLNPEINQSQKKYPIRILTTAIHKSIENEDSRSIENIKRCINTLPTKKVILNYLAYYTYSRYMQNKKWLQALLHYEFILSMLKNETLAEKDYSVYCNALYVLQHDVTGLGVQHERNKKMLSICLQFAQHNPAIYFNAATLYVEMVEYDEALINFKHYFSSSDKDKIMLYEGLMAEKMYEGFRNYKNVKFFLNKVKEEIS